MAEESPSVLDRALDEIVADRSSSKNRRRGGGGNRTPRDGVSKQSRPLRDPGRGNWVHDKYGEGLAARENTYRPRDDANVRENQRSSKIRVENLHYDLGEADVREVFSRVGEIRRVDIIYDKAGRSEGIATVLYTTPEEAILAVDQFDGANAKGQPIRVKIAPLGGRRGGNAPAVNEGRSLFERVAGTPQEADAEDAGRGDHRRQRRDFDEMRNNAKELGIDRYIPGDRGGDRGGARDTRPRRGGGGGGGMGGERERHRGDGRRDGRGGRGAGRGGGRGVGGRGGGRGGEEKAGGSHRPRKTADELDAEMNDYWTTSGDNALQSTFAPGGNGQSAGEQQQPQQGFGGNNAFMAQVENAAKVSAIDVDEDL